eukprot:gnl/Spiro4/18329_TR9809_c0_g1_i2.p1 gnl/Spiro4/18329_TR9809_c0_g1~~gnl/Spiro4/18329_TR9809_c0_g1_i2.p1  ORF type:complete len:1321 (-),score=343.91 gnl/Spiro4/18329_TR9809_c0_g1_i2:4-3927(-)
MEGETRFVIPVHFEDLTYSTCGAGGEEQYCIASVPSFNEDSVDAAIDDVNEDLNVDCTRIVEHRNFDVLYGVLRNFSRISTSQRKQFADLLHGCLSSLVENCGECDGRATTLNQSLKMVVFLMSWTVTFSAKMSESEKDKAASSCAVACIETVLRSLAHSLKKAESMKAAWNGSNPDEAFCLLYCRATSEALQRVAVAKSRGTRASIAAILSALERSFGVGHMVVSSLVDLIHKFEHVPALAADILLDIENSASGSAVVQGVIQNIGSTVKGDTSGTKCVATFLQELADRLPKVVLSNISSLVAYLGGESYTMRNATIYLIGRVVKHFGPCSSVSAAKTRDHLLDILEQRVRDVNAHVRNKVLQTWTFLCDEGLIPVARVTRVAELAVRHCADKGALARRSSMQLLASLLQHNPFGFQLSRTQISSQLNQLEAAVEAHAEREVHASLGLKTTAGSNNNSNNSSNNSNAGSESQEQQLTGQLDGTSATAEEGHDGDGAESSSGAHLTDDQANSGSNTNDVARLPTSRKRGDGKSSSSSNPNTANSKNNRKSQKSAASKKKKPTSSSSSSKKSKKTVDDEDGDDSSDEDDYSDEDGVQRDDGDVDDEADPAEGQARQADDGPPPVEPCAPPQAKDVRALSFQQAINAVAFFRCALAFTTSMENALPQLYQLLGSRTSTDALEAVKFFSLAHAFKLEHAAEGIRKMNLLVWSKDSAVRDALFEAFTQIHFSPHAGDILLIARALIELTNSSSLAEQTSLAQLLGHLMSSNAVPRKLVKVLCAIFAGSSAGLAAEHRRGAVMLLGMLASVDCELVKSNLGLLVAHGLTSLDDLELARHTCVCVQQLSRATHFRRLPHSHPMFPPLRALLLAPSSSPLWYGAAEQSINAIYKLACSPEVLAAQIVRAMAKEVFDLPDRRGGASSSSSASATSNTADSTEPAPAAPTTSVPHTQLAHFVFVLGHVALKTLLYMEEVHRRLKQRQQQATTAAVAAPTGSETSSNNSENSDPNATPNDDTTPTTTTTADGRKKRQSKGKALVSRGGKGLSLSVRPVPGGAACDDDELAGAMDTAGAEETEEELKREMAERELVGKNLLGIFGPVITSICCDLSAFRHEELRTAAVLTLAKFMCISSDFCENHLRLLFTILRQAQEAPIRSNIVICLGDIALRFPNLLEPWVSHVYERLSDPDARVRKNTVMVLTHLILNDMTKIKAHVCELILCLVDVDPRIQDLTKLFLQELAHKDSGERTMPLAQTGEAATWHTNTSGTILKRCCVSDLTSQEFKGDFIKHGYGAQTGFRGIFHLHRIQICIF